MMSMKITVTQAEAESIKRLKEVLTSSHFVDLDVRKDGKSIKFQADWLLDVVPQLELEIGL